MDKILESQAQPIIDAFASLEERILLDIVRRIRKMGEITSTADYQIQELYNLGRSSAEIEAMIQDTLHSSLADVWELYDKTAESQYIRDRVLYEQINDKRIPFSDNEQLQQLIEAAKQQAGDSLENISGSLGMVSQVGGQITFLPLTTAYQHVCNNAIVDITSGAFDYNSVLKKSVRQLSKYGISVIDYASGYVSRLAVAVRRSIMTGASQMAGRISEMNAEKLDTQFFEIDWHAGARPTHREWQGKVWSKEQLVAVCGLGEVTGLKGANCYHDYYPFIPGVSERKYTDQWLAEQNRLEDIPKEWKGKEYTAYEARQKQRQMETAMRAQREKVRLLEAGGADPDDILLEKARYQAQLDEYAKFSRSMGLKQHRERIYIDNAGRVAPTIKEQNRLAEIMAENGNEKVIDTRDKAAKMKPGIYPTTQEKIDLIVNNELKNIHFTAKLVYNSRIRSAGKTLITVYPWGDRKISKMEIGKQYEEGNVAIIDSLVHEELEARIAIRALFSNKYSKLDKMTDDKRHKYIQKVIDRYIRMKGFK